MPRFTPSGFNNEPILNERFELVIYPYYKKNLGSNKHIVLLLDSATFNYNEKLSKRCKELNIDIIIIPGGTTGFLQAKIGSGFVCGSLWRFLAVIIFSLLRLLEICQKMKN